ncbi:DHA1 family bicyclomycin/chloramphenicol resistance-like MFS transporter [Pseudoclavibacter chungangensis]|nr:multidrug effflux MFS transporter [Pseudoclavibacter chungangensis]NYJ67696.1 DHA1 family bicyclomycin/chloramphenicol resistance-like MFS transporter [Pseudoclavibacter chungangensis]
MTDRTDADGRRADGGPSALLLVALGALGAFGPLSMDLYLPGLPVLAADLAIGDTLAQLTMSACMVGLAIGQLVAGPMSDRIGRRVPILVGVAGFTIASLVCAFAGDVVVLLVARAVQGFAGAAGIVVSRAIVRDLADGAGMARIFSRLMIVTGLAPVLAPLLGGALLVWTDWRGLFVTLSGIGAALFVLAWSTVPDTLAPERRSAGGLRALARRIGGLLGDVRFMGMVLAAGLAQCVLFSYISMSALVLQNQFGLSEVAFAALFAVNSVMIVACSQVNVFFVGRTTLKRIVLGALAVGGVGSCAMLVGTWFGLGLVAVLVPLLGVVGMQGFLAPNLPSLALQDHASGAGTAAALIGTSQFLVGAIVPPLAALGGANAAVMATTMLACGVLAFALVALLVREGPSTPRRA